MPVPPRPAPPAGAMPAAEVFAAQRARLVGVAYRITGSLADAEDAVQEAWLRFERAGPEAVDRPAAWLTTTTARLALDQLKSARHRRERYVGPWLPEPLAAAPPGTAPGAAAGPEEAAELAQSLTLGFLHLLETLAPVDRVVFILADVFDVPYREIAPVVGRNETACRQIASRARRRVREAAPPPWRAPDDAAAGTVASLLHATMAGDVGRVVSLLAEDAVLISDGGAAARAARRPIRGAERMARFLVNLARRFQDATFEPVRINGDIGVVGYQAGERIFAMAVHVDGGTARSIHILRNPDKLAALDRPVEAL